MYDIISLSDLVSMWKIQKKFLLSNKARKTRLCSYERKIKGRAIMKEVYVLSRVLSTLKRV